MRRSRDHSDAFSNPVSATALSRTTSAPLSLNQSYLTEQDLVAGQALAALAKSQSQRDAVAWGLSWGNRLKVGVFSDNEGLSNMKLAAALTKQEDLSEWISFCLRVAREAEESRPPNPATAAPGKTERKPTRP